MLIDIVEYKHKQNNFQNAKRKQHFNAINQSVIVNDLTKIFPFFLFKVILVTNMS